MTLTQQAAGAELPVSSESEDLSPLYLFPGQLITTAKPSLVTTILGSCVSVCLWDDDRKIGGINHFLLPSNPMRSGADARYGATAMPRLLEEMLDRGATAARLVAKIFGGAAMVCHAANGRPSIGEQNAIVARDFLRRHDIPVAAEQTGGRSGRKLLFHTGTGSAYVKEI